MRLRVLICSAFLVFSIAIRAQSSQYQFSHLDVGSGLSHNHVTSIFKDSQGFMWFGTISGLNRYDGYKFKVFTHNRNDSTSINDDYVESIQEGPEGKLWILTRFGFNIYDPQTEKFNHRVDEYLNTISTYQRSLIIKKDRRGNFWFMDASHGIYRYNPATKKTDHFYHRKNDNASLYSDNVSNIAEDSHGDFWVVYTNGVIDKINSGTNKVSYRSYRLKDQNPAQTLKYALAIDRDDDLWIYSKDGSGVYYFSPKLKQLKHLTKNGNNGNLNSNLVNNIIQDNSGLIWIATDHGGINLLNKKNFEVRYLVNREDDKKSISQNSIESMYKDNWGIIWVGTYKRGLNYYHPDITKFQLIRRRVSDPRSLNYEDINRFAEDAKGNLWIGTNGGGLIYFDRKANTFLQYKHNASNKNSLCNDVIVSLCIDHQQKLWIGTYAGGLDCFDGKTFTHYRHSESDTTSISDDRVWEIFEDSERNLWIGTLKKGLNRLDRKKNIFYHYKLSDPDSVKYKYIPAIVEDKAGNMWFGSATGIDVLLKKSRKIRHYSHNESDPQSLINDNISNMLIDSRGLLWVGTREGLSMLNPQTGKFKNFRKEDGLPDNIVLDILEDNNHTLWLSTSNGLSNLILYKTANRYVFKFKNYDESEGLQGLEFNESASLKTLKGELIFGGPNGFNIFDPASIQSAKSTPVLVLTDLQVFNKSVAPGDKINGDIILNKSITESRSITLKHNENVFSIEFADLNFFNTDKVKLQYMLDGFDTGWLIADNEVRKATYTNLDPGTYTFKVRATNEYGSNEGKVLNFQIKVLPPFWKTNLAYLIYLSLFAGSLLYLRKRGIRKIRNQFALEQERQETKRMRELDMMKIKFFTNVSHEFRTPLSLIMAPADKMLKLTDEPEQTRQLQMINRNARRLLNMVNQLLDFRKMEVHELKLHPKPGDIIKFIKEIAYSFTDVAEKKNIGFLFDCESESLETQFDHDKIERILFNLLSNSFKFTTEGGHVSVLLNLVENNVGLAKVLEIKVMDTGIGMPKEKQDKIFERFFQHDVPGSMVNQGSGIGLSITKEFVKLHGGEISVESNPGEGSCFIVRLPILSNSIIEETQPKDVQKKVSAFQASEVKLSGKKQTVLLVEDNDDFRFYLKDNLRESFNIIEAANGKEGWQKALALHPNLVVSDISMPEMDGIALCKKIKSDPRTAHIPIVLLTALTGEEQQLEGLETGASDYMTKPFTFEILLSKIKNILHQQESMRKTYQKQVEVKPSDVVVESPDDVFVRKALLVIEKNISNPDFSVEELSSEMCMSRVTLYKKLLTVTGKTPVEFIRSVRIKRAAQLLEKGHLTISQIGYKVGFKTQKYFVKLFKEEYGVLPSVYIEQTRKLNNP